MTAFANSGFRIGHLLNDLITGFILSELFEVEYLHSPLPEKWEDFFGFGEGEKQFSDILNQKRKNITIKSCSPLLGLKNLSPRFHFLLNHIALFEYYTRKYLKKVPISRVQSLTEPYWGNPFWEGAPLDYIQSIFSHQNGNSDITIYCFQKALRVMPYQIQQWGKAGLIDNQVYEKFITKLRYKYHKREHPSKKSYFNSENINIAIHIRREDATPENQRFLPLDFHINIAQEISKILNDFTYIFHIYSYCNDQDRKEICEAFNQFSPNIEYHFNQPAMVDLHHMIIADILITCHSSFSDWAGFLSENIKLYHPHFFAFDLDEKDWLEVDLEGNFDTARLQEMLSQRRILTKG